MSHTNQGNWQTAAGASAHQHATLGAVTELSPDELRVVMTPQAVIEFVQNGHTVYFQSGFGNRAGFTDDMYTQAGAKQCNSAEDVYRKSSIIVKVEAPQPQEYSYIQPQQVIFCFANVPCAKQQQQFLQAMMERQATVISYNTLMGTNTQNSSTTTTSCFPVDNALAELSGYLAVQQAMTLTQATTGNLFGRMSGVPGRNVLVLGASPCGIRAAAFANAAGANVTLMCTDTEALRMMNSTYPSINTINQNKQNLEAMLPTVDILLGTSLSTASRPPIIVTEEQLRMMRPGSVAIDVASCSGKNFAATRPATIQNPTYDYHGICMYSATNLTSLAPKSASFAIAQAALSYMLQVASKGWRKAVLESLGLQQGVCVASGYVTNPTLATSTGCSYTPVEQVLEREIKEIANTQQQANIANLKQQLTTFRIQQSPFTIQA